MKRTLLLLFFAIGLGYLGWGQTNPAAFDLSLGSFSFTTQTATLTTYPANMQGWTTGTNNLVGITTAAPGADQALVASGTASTSGLSNLGINGFNFLSTGSSPNRQVGELCVALNSTARTNLKVTWIAADQTSGSTREMNVTLQYRIGTSGTFTTVTSSTYTTANTSQKASQTFTDVSLPAECDNKSVVQIRWITYESASQSGGRDAIRIDDISVSSSIASNTTPTVTTQALTSIGTTTATGNGNITATGGVDPTVRGFCWDLASNADPDITDSKVEETGTFSTGAYTGNISGLTAGTQYKVKAFATNTEGTGYGDVVTFYTLSTEPSNHPSTFTATANSQTSITTAWLDNDGAQTASGFLIFASTTNSFTDPVDGTAQSDETNLGDGVAKVNVAHGVQSYLWNTGLSAGTQYFFKIFAYNGSGTSINYKTDPTVPTANATTSAALDATSEVSGPALGSQPNPALVSSLADTDGEAIRVFDMDIYDNATSDAQSTKITQVTIKAGAGNTADWTNTIQGVKLSTDAGSSFATIGTPIIGASSIVIPITSGNLNIPNGSALTVSLYIYLKSSGLTDNQILEFKVDATAASHGFTADATGSTFLATFATAPVSNQILVDVVGTKFRFSTQPSNTTVNTNFSAAVEALDANNNRDLDATTSVTLNASTGTLSSVTGLTQNLATGVYSWTDLQNNTAGTGVTLDATGALTTATSTTFRILSAEPTTQASAILFSNVGMNSMTVSWTNGAGTNRIVVVKAAGTPGTPTDGSTYSANSEYGLGGTIAANEYVLYSGTGSTVDVTGLTGSTTYTFKVFEFNGSSGTENYLTTSNATTQATAALTYYSNGSGDPATLTNWKTNRDGSGSSPANFTSGEVFVIENADNMTTTTTWSISGTNSKVWIENGGTLTANNAITLAAATTFQIDNGGTYVHNNTSAFGSTIFQGTESFGNNSTVEFKDWNTTGPNVSSWGNVKFNATGAVAGSMQLSGAMTIINGNLEIIATGSTVREIRLTSASNLTLNIAGNLIISGGSLNTSSGAGNTTINLSGNLSFTGGTLTESSTGSGKIVFNKSGLQTFTSGGTISNVINFEVAATSISDFGTNVISGGGAFTLSDGATLKTAHASGLNGSITVSGTKTLSTAANYEFTGTGAQVTGALLPATVNNLNTSGTSQLTLSNAGLLTVANNMTIGSGTSLTVGSAQTLTVTGTLTNSAGNTGLLIASDASGSGSLIHSTAGVAGTVNRYIAALTDASHGWHFLSSPVSSQAISVFHTANSGNDFYKWDEATNLWINRTATGGGLNGSFETNFGVGTGYLIANTATTTPAFTGNLNVADVSISGLAKSSGGFHLLGNPFSSALVWDKTGGSWAMTNIAATCQIWNEASASYSVISTDGIIPANNGFMVYTTGDGSLTIPASARTHNATNWYKQTETIEGQIKLLASDIEGQTAQETIIGFNDNATESFDMMQDAYFMAGYAPMFYSVNNDEIYALNCLPVLNEQTTIPVGFVKNSGSNFSIELTQNITGLIVYLTDLKTNQTQNLCEGKYNFTSANGDNANRFTVHFGALGINETPTNHLNAYVSNNNLYVTNESGKAQLQIFDIHGRLIESVTLNSKGLISHPVFFKAGVYVVRLLSENTVKSVKIVVSE